MIKDRVIQLIEYKGIAKEAFYTKIGMTSANFRGTAKKTPLNSTAIENVLSEIPDANPMWLLTGKGNMILSNITADNDLIIYLREKDKKIEELLQENIRLKIELEKLKNSSTASSDISSKHVG